MKEKEGSKQASKEARPRPDSGYLRELLRRFTAQVDSRRKTARGGGAEQRGWRGVSNKQKLHAEGEESAGEQNGVIYPSVEKHELTPPSFPLPLSPPPPHPPATSPFPIPSPFPDHLPLLPSLRTPPLPYSPMHSYKMFAAEQIKKKNSERQHTLMVLKGVLRDVHVFAFIYHICSPALSQRMNERGRKLEERGKKKKRGGKHPPNKKKK